MTGAYLRIKRDDKWQNVEVEHLTRDERRNIFKDRRSDELLNWMDMLCDKIRENEQLLDQLIDEGVLKRVDDYE